MDRSTIRALVLSMLLLVSTVGMLPGVLAQEDTDFNGEVVLNGSSASDGTDFSYDLDDEEVDDFEVDITGQLSEQEIDSSGSTRESTSETIDVGGNTDPTDSELSISTSPYEWDYDSGSGDPGVGLTGSESHTETYSVDTDTLDSAVVTMKGTDSTAEHNYDIYIDGSKEGSVTVPSQSTSTHDAEMTDLDHDVDDGEVEIEVQSDGTEAADPGEWDRTQLERTADTDEVDVSVNGDTETLEDGDSIDPDLSTGSNDIDFEPDGGGEVDWEVNTTERTETRDPEVDINGETVSYDGSLEDDETESLDVDEDWIEQNGSNNVSVSTNDPDSGPGSQVDLDYRHLTTGPSQESTVDSSEWEESINSSRTFSSDQEDVNATMRFSETVVDIYNVEYRINDDSWQEPDNHDFSGQTLEIPIGDVEEDDELDVRGDARKVRVDNGEIDVTDPTVEGDALDTEIEIEEKDDDFGIDTSETSDRIHYSTDRSWEGDEDYVEIDDGGSQLIRLPDASTGSTTRIQTAPLSMQTSGESTGVIVDDPDQPEITIKDLDEDPDSIDIDYLDAGTDRSYELYSVTNDRSIRTADEQDGIASLSTEGGAESYVIQEYEDTSGAAVSVGSDDDSGGESGPLTIISLFVALGSSIVGSLILGRRLGVGDSRLLLVVGGVVGVVGIELVSPRSIVSDLLLSLSRGFDAVAGGFVDSGIGTISLGVLLLLGIYMIEQRLDTPIWFALAGGVITVVWMVDSISGGALTGSLGDLGPLLWLVILGGSVVLLYRALQPTQINVGGEQ